MRREFVLNLSQGTIGARLQDEKEEKNEDKKEEDRKNEK